jgi:hypothetical protein
VNIVDSLPNEVGSITFSPASCDLINHKVTCPVDNLTQAGAAQIVISATVETAQTMNLINNVTASSASTHDPYLSNNTAETNNLVDVTLPVVNWERPVHNGGTYFTFGGMVMLEASASDNDQVDYVKFLLFDHLHNLWITIGTIYTAPYQVEFNSNILVLKESYQVFAQGFDRVGNNIWQRIFIERLFPHPTYMPFIHKN